MAEGSGLLVVAKGEQLKLEGACVVHDYAVENQGRQLTRQREVGGGLCVGEQGVYSAVLNKVNLSQCQRVCLRQAPYPGPFFLFHTLLKVLHPQLGRRHPP